MLSRSRTWQTFGVIVNRMETEKPVVALTFDDGPTPQFTEEILATLKEEDVKATFFLIGKELSSHPDQGKMIAEAGHEIGNHTYSHRRMAFVSPSFVKSEIEKTEALIVKTGFTQRKPALFRPPYGKKLFTLPWYLDKTGRTSITWDIEPESYPDVAATSETITRHIIDNTRNGSIILLHIMYDRERKSLNAVRPVIHALRDRGFQFVTVSELLSGAS